MKNNINYGLPIIALLILIIVLQVAVIVDTKLSVPSKAVKDFTLLPIEEVVKESISAAENHQYLGDEVANSPFNYHWRDVHQSAAYYLQRIENLKE